MGTMTENFRTSKTKGGFAWTPRFIEAIDAVVCIGCGRCYKVCGRDVLNLVEFEDEDENQKMVMEIENADNCIGCESCAKVCSTKCLTHAPLREQSLNDYVKEEAYQL